MEKQNEPLSSLTHLIGAVLSVAALVLLVVFAALRGTAWHVTSFAIFGSTLILLYISSTIYHFLSHPTAKNVFKKIDHSMIYVLIAGTYTPICLVALRGGWGWTLFGIVWGLTALGIVFSTATEMNKLLSTLVYVAMGWLVVIAFVPLVKAIPFAGLMWMVAGGIFYTVGAVFHELGRIIPGKRWFGMHDIFHILVLAGSFCHFWLMFKYILYL
jgi:hemolysin III